MRRERRENRHHLIGKSLKDEYNVHEDCNKIKMDEHRHNALHALFGLLLTPKEQLKELECLYDTILSNTAKTLFLELINMRDDQFYNPKLLKKKSFKNNK